MRRLLMMVPVAALVVTGFVPAQADEGDAQKTPIVVVCKATAGYEEVFGTGEVHWVAEAERQLPSAAPVNRRACATWSSDTADGIGPPPPPPDLNPTTPDDFFWWVDRWLGPTNPTSLGGKMRLAGNGDFACGEGTLTRSGASYFDHTNSGVAHGPGWRWHLDWTASFENGVGELDGTAVRNPWPEANNPRETRSLSGRIFVNDGAAYGQCDDSAGAAQVVAVFVLE